MKYAKSIITIISLATPTPSNAFIHNHYQLTIPNKLSTIKSGLEDRGIKYPRRKYLKPLFSEVQDRKTLQGSEEGESNDEQKKWLEISQENQQLQEQLALLGMEQKSYIIEREAEVEHIEELSGELLSAKNRISQLNRKLEEQSRKTRRAEQEKFKVEHQTKKLQKTIDEQAKKASEASTKEAELQAEISHLKLEILELQDAGKAPHESMRELQLELREAMAAEKTAKAEKERAELKLEQSRIQFQEENNSLKELMDKNRQSYQKMFEELEQEELALHAQLEGVHDLEKQVALLQQREKDALQKAQEEQKQAKALKEGLGMLESKVFYETNDKHMALAELEQLKVKYEEDMRAQKETIAQYVADIDKKDDYAFKARAAIQRTRNQVQKLERQKKEAQEKFEGELEKMKEQLVVAENRHQQLQTLSAGKQLMHDTLLEARHDVLRRKQNLHGREKKQLQSQIKTLELQIEELQQQLEAQSKLPGVQAVSWFGSLKKSVENFVLGDFDMHQTVERKEGSTKKVVDRLSQNDFNPV
mmetsp:Transcript_1000/g.1262  ORF Transcript_1000/g.1262 Transcript_1000/m.1262 type:complete len:533 (+) Transcript_1000:292-1890(+)|eukprot:CAMPEP_0117760568 /NCGR_PEP_ID=MMETSP0947-20121206/16707_1 /TAXON_ID=44440 /ORGANISM="Chattonella subsalsa, Strain CCMP2191" /LENGTH=532 /DNA_ID=CAMNT_0005581283 /DNA_START=218 /DNA_END=1816 /DNA_ORIENTATION=+